MVAAKGKSHSLHNPMEGDHYMQKSGIRSFKVYGEKEIDKAHERARVVNYSSRELVLSDRKIPPNLPYDRNHSARIKSKNFGRTRRVLADVSNFQVSSGKQGHDDASSMVSVAPVTHALLSTENDASIRAKKLVEKSRTRLGGGKKNVNSISNDHKNKKPGKSLQLAMRKSLPLTKTIGSSSQSNLKQKVKTGLGEGAVGTRNLNVTCDGRKATTVRVPVGPVVHALLSTAKDGSIRTKKLVEKSRTGFGEGTKNVNSISNDHLTRKPGKNLQLVMRKSFPLMKTIGSSSQSNFEQKVKTRPGVGAAGTRNLNIVCDGRKATSVRKPLSVAKVATAKSHQHTSGDGQSGENGNSGGSAKGRGLQKVKIRARYMRVHGMKSRTNGGSAIMVSKSKALLPKKPPKKDEKKRRDAIEAETSCSGASDTARSEAAGGNAHVKHNPRRKRRSFTSQLLNEGLPSIDDECNPLQVSEYIDAIYLYYWNNEANAPSLADYMKDQTQITPKTRGILINWLIEVHYKFGLMPETLYLTTMLVDRYLFLTPSVKKNDLQLLGLASILLSSKYEDFWHPKVRELISISAEMYTREQLIDMEKCILQRLKFSLNLATPYVFMVRFLKAARADNKVECLAFYLIELCLVEYGALKFKASMLCASAIYVAHSTLRVRPAWTPLLSRHTHYDEPHIRECAEMVLGFHRAAKNGVLNVARDKYSLPDFSYAAELEPLENLPPV